MIEMETKNKMTNYEKIMAHYPDIEKYEKQYGYIFFPKKRLEEWGYKDRTELVVHYCLIYNSIPRDNKEFVTNLISINNIVTQMNIKNNKSRKAKIIIESLQALERDGVISIDWLEGEPWNKNSLFTATQYRDDDESLIPTKSNAWSKIFTYQEFNDREREGMFATFLSVSSKLNLLSRTNNIDKDSYDSFFNMANVIGWENVDSIGSRIDYTRNTAGEYMDKLEELKLIAIIKVRFIESSYYTNMYSRYEDAYILKRFASYCSSKNVPTSKNGRKDYSYLKIIDVKY